MRYVILGAGAIGGTIGALLAESGQQVVLVARGEHARVMAATGLRLAMPDRVLTVHPPVLDDVAALDLQPGDILITASKTQHTAALLEAIAGRPESDRVVVMCAQNGVENERVALRLFPHVLGCCLMLPAVHLEPGRVDAQGTPYPGMLEIGPYPAGAELPGKVTLDDVVADLAAAGFRTTGGAHVMRWKYAKLIRNTGNAVTALCGQDLDEAGRRVVHQIDRQAGAEAARVLDQAGIDYVSDAEWDRHRGHHVQVAPVEGRARTGGSSWQSIQRGTGSIESDALNGEIVLLARLSGERAPVNEVLQREATALARRRGRPGEMSPQQLAARVAEWETRQSETLHP
jgi:2-dehydropantoate 2-reductase